MAQTLLVTGGAGYIGTHTLVELVAAGWQPLVYDNFSNGSREALARVARIVGREIPCIEGDVRDGAALDAVFAQCASAGAPVTCVLHLAALKVVGESIEQPVRYYDNNVQGTLVLLAAMERARVRRFVFSSSANVYGEPEALPYTEGHRISPTNPYGRSKSMVETVLRDVATADPSFSAVVLRYFNPIGAHPSGLIGEDPRGVPDNIFPYITQVAVGQLAALSVFGDDYPTPDGTGIRDYLHIVDLARGHVKAVEYAMAHPGWLVTNLGTGRGTSVLELVAAFEKASGRPVPCRIAPRRAGDIGEAWADPSLAARTLGWTAQYDIDTMCADGWRWQSGNPDGYTTSA
ncbi:UDP-glucose 4-epimerase GalE [Achromobacter sp. GG226]|uniref:UDP-glucose 4-epimerase GalE n=1 Tax=Verticiella alkaliphila TaxID=2779529 RepID=UPI001C0E0A38|nr:UDP-glucose 4-epimerase GalE [Verticiella sp. GG226]MBU4612721.1 UDP-glucose 4-epimerase GalE [Verticiella sp. GG226]